MKKIKSLLVGILPKYFKRKDMKRLRMQVFLCSIIKTHAFKKLTLQDKLSSLARLITLAQADHGFAPKELDRMIRALSERLNDDMAEMWDKSYTQYFKNAKNEFNVDRH